MAGMLLDAHLGDRDYGAWFATSGREKTAFEDKNGGRDELYMGQSTCK